MLDFLKQENMIEAHIGLFCSTWQQELGVIIAARIVVFFFQIVLSEKPMKPNNAIWSLKHF